MSTDGNEISHGNSPAAWTAVAIMLVAVFAGTIALYVGAIVIVIACAILGLIGIIVGYIMRKLGYGVGGSKLTVKAR
jgi:hypothetical protein